MPESLASLVLFLGLLAPGFVYLQRREGRHPGIKYSALRETSLVVIISAATIAVAAGAVGVVRVTRPSWTPNVRAYVDGGTPYLRGHYVEATWWLLSTLLAACALAWVWACPPRWLLSLYRRAVKIADPIDERPNWRTRFDARLVARIGSEITSESGWGKAFRSNEGSRRLVDVRLIDGTWIRGGLHSFSAQVEESADRDLVLRSPLAIRYTGPKKNWLPFAEGVIVVNASQISFFSVRYVDPDLIEAAGEKAEETQTAPVP